MPVNVSRKNILFEPDSSRVIARLLYTNKERSLDLIKLVMALTPKRQQEALTEVLRDYSKRHRSISKIFEKHFHKMADLLGPENIDPGSFTTSQKVL
ncbi:MAG: glycosidase, partial [Ferruginibacter sp.]|nr:glycosidase [Ferruginibacter sp.]